MLTHYTSQFISLEYKGLFYISRFLHVLLILPGTFFLFSRDCFCSFSKLTGSLCAMAFCSGLLELSRGVYAATPLRRKRRLQAVLKPNTCPQPSHYAQPPACYLNIPSPGSAPQSLSFPILFLSRTLCQDRLLCALHLLSLSCH